MARIEGEQIAPKAIAIGAVAIIVAIMAWATVDGIYEDRDHGGRITALENRQEAVINEIYRRLGVIEEELRAR
jgi:hypothetical protein